jgi:hypothetical protein
LSFYGKTQFFPCIVTGKQRPIGIPVSAYLEESYEKEIVEQKPPLRQKNNNNRSKK